MNNYFSPKFSVSEEVRSTAVALIKEFNIDRTFDLALFLNVNPNLNDQDAVLAWVNHFSKIQYNLNDFKKIIVFVLKWKILHFLPMHSI